MNSKKLLLAILFVFACASSSFGQILTFDFFGIAGNEATAGSNFNNANLTASTISRGAGLTATANGDRFNATQWAVTSIANAVSGNNYMEFTITPAVGYQFDVSSIYLQLQRSATGPSALVLRSSVDGYTANLDTQYSIVDNTSTQAFTFTFAQANSATAVTYRVYMYAEATTGSGGIGDGTGNDIVVNGTVTPTVTGITTAANGNWNVGATWTGGVVPTAAQNAIINHNVTLDVNVTRNSGTTTTVSVGAGRSLSTGVFTYTNNGITNVDGILTINNGGYVGGANNLVYGAASTLNMSHGTGAAYVLSAGQRFWPVANPPFNVNINSNSPTQLNMAVGAVEGQLTLAAGLDVVTANALTVNGILRINANGFVNTNSPIYGAASTLQYNSGGTFGRGFEWRAPGVGIIGTTPGYPNNVFVLNNTTLDYINTLTHNVVLDKAIAGNLTIASGSALNMDTGAIQAGGSLIVGGFILVSGPSGALRLGVGTNDHLRVGGDFTVTTTAVFDGKQRRVYFTNNSVVQNITGPSITIPYLYFEPASGSTAIQLNGTSTSVTVSAPLGGTAISFNSPGDTFDISTFRTLTIGTTGIANVISGAGNFKGLTTSTLNLLGTGSIGTLNFLTGFQNLGTFTVNRTSGAVACVMGSNMTIASLGAMNLTAGIIDLNASTFTINATASLSGTSSSNYFIADDAFGGILRKGYTGLGSFTFPIGDKTGTMEYSPASINFTAGTGSMTAAFVGMSVNDSQHPNMAPAAHSISRYWSVTRAGTINTPTYTFTGTYLPIDILGTETSSLSQFWNGSAWSPVGTFLFSNTVSYGGCTYLPTSGSNHHTGGLRDREINIRQGATNIASGGTYNFANTAASSFIDVVFTIENLGNSNLLLYSNTSVVAPFSLTTPFSYNVTISNLGTATFTIRFAPLTAGPFTGSISFANNDSDENPYVINFTGIGTGSVASDILKVNTSEPLTIPSTTTGTIATITDGIEVWRFNLRDGGASSDADALATTMTDLVITQSAGDQIGNWDESIADIVLVNLATNTIVAHGVVTTNQIQFNPISVVAADNTSVLLGLRLTLKCPLGVGAIDGDDFGFTISNANVTFAASGSGKTTFSVQTSTNSRNVIAIVATKLTFTTQPITTGVSVAMGSVVVAATDACGNVDRDWTGSVALTSSGTMNPVGPITLTTGSATFTGITHTVVGTDYNLTAITGILSGVSTLFDISTITILNKGDLAVLAVNTNTNVASGTDEVAFVCFRDLLVGTNLFITDNGYERKSAGLWGGTEGVISITRTGSTLPKGNIITIRTTTANASSASHFDVYVCGVIDTNWTKTVIGGSGFNLNGDDDIYFMQGGIWTNDTGHASTYTGNVLYAWTESGWDLAPGGLSGDTKWSTLYPGMECFSTIAPTGDGFVKFNDPIDPDFTTDRGKFDWIALINNQANWNTYADNTDYVANGYNYAGSCKLVGLTGSVYVNGRWNGRKDTNWFNCENWETLIVPTAITDVIVPTATNDAEIVAGAPFAIYSNYIAKAKNLTITGQKVSLKDNLANKLEIHGNLTIANTVADNALDMNGGTATAYGQLYLYGNWTNNKNNDAFNEGNGRVHFVGTTPQMINAVTPLGTEIFKHVTLDNNFDTAVSNDLYVTGDLNVNTGKTLDIDAAGYANVYDKLTSDGNIIIQSNGQLVQVNDTDTNAGTYSGTTFEVKRNYTAKNVDYVYWGSPTKLFNVVNLPTGYRYEWNPINANTNGTQGNWIVPSTATMTDGKGYIARTFNGSGTPITLPFSFYGKPNNGLINVTIARGTYTGDGIITGLDYDAEPANPNNVLTTRWDDNWNLVGNPYPSAINSLKFLTANTNIEGFINIWTHATPPSSTIDPFYYNFGYSYTPADYITYNGTGTISGPSGFNGNIASGQGFFVLMNEGTAATSSIFFNNAMRSDISTKLNYNNSQFYRTDNQGDEDEKNRIWLDLIAQNDQIVRTLVGYISNATNDSDRLYDAVTSASGLKLYSFSEDVPLQPLCIQGKTLPFDQQDTIKLGYSSNSAGNYKIAIGAVDGLFTNNQNIYLEDKVLNSIHDLRESPYTFITTKGVFNDRFVLRYTTQALGNTDFDNANQVVISTNHSQINITSKTETIRQVQVFDMLGREIYTVSNLETLQYSLENNIKNQALIIKVTLTNGVVISKKIIVN